MRCDNFLVANDPVSEKIEKFVRFLDHQLAKKGWTDYQLAKRAGISSSVISHARQGKLPKWDACEKIATALGIPPEMVFRAAGLLPPSVEQTEDLNLLNHLFTQLDEEDRQDILTFMETKIKRKEEREQARRRPRPSPSK